MGISQSMIDSVLKVCECLNHVHVNCKSKLCEFEMDTNETTTVDSLPSMEEDETMDSFRTLPPPDDFLTSNEHNHQKVLTR
jgi:hypothetical protein